MTATDGGIDALKREFDARFTQIAPPRPTSQRFLRVQAGHELLLPLAQVASVLPLPRLAPVPVGRPGLLGVGAVGGRTVAVYGLADLVRGASVIADQPGDRWLIVPSAAPDVAFAVAEVLDLVDIVSSDLASKSQRDGP
ncbi:MAG: chemotaxis protein CheW, partial [Planctomycetes bacterium]|nr:chemotaxis protein CheW [Planctomycetota bacterium]